MWVDDFGGVMGGTGADPGGGLTEEQAARWQAFVSGGWSLYRTFLSRLEMSSPLSSSDWRMLEVLKRVGHMRISDLSASTHIAISTVSRQVSRLIESGHVVRVDADGDTDARQKWVAITDEGNRVLMPILATRDRLVRELVVDKLSAEEFDMFCDLMSKVGGDLPARV